MHTERWRIALTEPNRERLAVDGLLRIGIPSYLPMIPVRRAAGRCSRITELPMFRGYLFVKFSTDMPGWTRLYVTPGIRLNHPLMMRGDAHATLPESTIEAISLTERRIHGEKNTLVKRMGLELGDKIRIRVGPWADMLGKIEDLDDDERVGVLINLLGKEHSVRIPAAQLAI